MLLLLDNYDSFTYNLAQYFGELGCEPFIVRNDAITIDRIAALMPTHICISPGPGMPGEAGISKEVVVRFGKQIPILGVCLGHQCIAEAFGGKVLPAACLMHGKSSPIYHNNASILSGLPSPFEAGRYHSLIVGTDSFPTCLEVVAQTDHDEIMALRHHEFPVHGVQFHPESILTRDGKKILSNFLGLKSR
jgi:anthranilate synthase/aminodeoxychorismate synthase-like glutamine amidotransferase